MQLVALTPGTYTGEASFATNDSDENPFNFTVFGEVTQAEPEIDVLDGTMAEVIDDETTVDFGVTPLGVGLSQTFTIRNEGYAALTLDSLSLPQNFALVDQFPVEVAPGSEATFELEFLANTRGFYGGEVTIGTNDTDEDPFTFFVAVAAFDNPPSFGFASKIIYVAETTAPTTVVTSMVATDSDGGSVTYAYTGGGGKFAVNAANADVTLTGALDFESPPPEYTITVTATDDEGDQARANLLVIVTDVNDESPNFPGEPNALQGKFSLGPHNKAGDVVGEVTATDKDKNDTITYSITGGDNPSDSLFEIDSKGRIKLKKAVPTTASTYLLEITATDAVGHTDTGTVQIDVRTVTVVVLGDVHGAEAGPDTITLEFRRITEDASQPLTVEFEVAWLSANSDDVDLTSAENLTAGTITFAANELTTSMTITPEADGVAEGIETFKVSLKPSSAYDLVDEDLDLKKKSEYDGLASTEVWIFDAVTPFGAYIGNTMDTDKAADGQTVLDIHVNDVIQGYIGDCWLMAALKLLAQSDPEFIRGMIVDKGDGSWDVLLYDENNKRKAYNVALSDLTMGNGMAWVTGDTHLTATGDRLAEIWPMLIENAFAQLKEGYGNLSGSTAMAWKHLTGTYVKSIDATTLTQAQIIQLLRNAVWDPTLVVGIGTPDTFPNGEDMLDLPAPDPDLYADHAYVVEGRNRTTSGVLEHGFKLDNPHGEHGDTFLPDNKVSEAVETIYIYPRP